MVRLTSTAPRRRSRGAVARRLILSISSLCWALGSPADAGTNREANISGLTDLAFGSITNLSVDNVRSEGLCVYAKSKPTDQYSITANGSGAGGAFTLSSGSANLAYDVQWSGSPNQITGTTLTPNQPFMGQQNSASATDCSSGAATTASLIVILRSSALAAATSGTYSGVLTLLVAPQ